MRLTEPQMLQQKKWQRQSIKFQNNLSVYIAGLPLQTSYWDLRNALSQFGEVCATFVSTLKENQTHKYGFGCFKLRSSVEKATQSELKVHGAIVTIRRRTKSNWKLKDVGALNPELAGPEAVSNATSSSVHLRSHFHPVNSNMTVQYSQVAAANHMYYMNSLPPVSPFVHPPEFTEFVHDTLASQYRTQRKLQAALLPVLSHNYSQGDTSSVHRPKITEGNSIGKVVRVDGVPSSWQAVNLFNFLSDHSVPLTNVLVYDDFDERGLRQALIQLVSSQATESLCSIGSLMSANIHLRFATSCVQSIGPVRRTYAGNFTAYSGSLHTTEKYGYSVTEPKEPSADTNVSITGPEVSLTFWPRSSGYLTPVLEQNSLSSCDSASRESHSTSDEIETPDTVVGPGSPLGKLAESPLSDAGSGSDAESDLTAAETDSEPQCATSFFVSKRERRQDPAEERSSSQFTELSPNKMTAAKSHQQPMNVPFYGPPQVPMLFPKASQTVIVDNFESRLVGDSENLCNWVSQFGEVENLDLVPLDEHRTRAYISYVSPLDAQYTMQHLQFCMSGSFRLSVRLA